MFPLPKGLSDLCPLFSLGDLLHPPSLLLVSPLIPLPVHEIQHTLLHELSFFAKEKEICYVQWTLTFGSAAPTSPYTGADGPFSLGFWGGEREKAMMKKINFSMN